MSGTMETLAAAWPVIKNIAVAMGMLRLSLHPVNVWLDSYVKKAMNPTQAAILYKLEGSFKVINFIVHLITSISPATLNAAAQVYIIGDRDSRIQVPYQAMGPLPSDPPPEKNQVQPKET
jgi:hypothetical protein